MSRKAKYYAVSLGRDGPAIYNKWDECKEKVSRYPGAIHRSFSSRKQAEDWLAQSTLTTSRTAPKQTATHPGPNASGPSKPPAQTNNAPPLSPATSSKISLSKEQNLVLSRVKNGHSVFFTGSAGTGKSVLLREIIQTLGGPSDTLGITASTGIAAVNIGGTTLHSWAGIGIGQESGKKLVGKLFGQPKFAPVLDRWKRVRALIIDEISMVDGALFDKLEYMARKIRHNESIFGGIQLVLSGDFCQLPPVPGRGERGKQMSPTFAFDAETWNACVGPPITLTRVFRQKDQGFVDMLNAMRFGKLDTKIIQVFNGLSRQVTYTDGIDPTELFSTRQEVDYANSSRLRQLNSESHIYPAVETPGTDFTGQRVTQAQMERLLERLLIPKSIELKVGAQVMLVKNLIPGELVNGSVGQVVKFCSPAEAQKECIRSSNLDKNFGKNPSNDWAWPVVRFVGGKEMMFIPQEFTVNNADGTMEARRIQIPLILAWALSVHKSQGQTLERVKVDLKRTFEKGQAYVALSRATSLETLQVLNFNPTKVEAHPRVLAWHNQYESNHCYDMGSDWDVNDIDNDEAMAVYYST